MINKTSLTAQAAIVKTLGLEHKSLSKLAQAGYPLDQNLVEIFDTTIAQIALQIKQRIAQGLSRRLPADSLAKIISYCGLPLRGCNLAWRAKTIQPDLSLYTSKTFLSFDPQECEKVDIKTLDLAGFDILMDAADTFTKRSHILNEGERLLPSLQEDLDIPIRDLFVLKSHITNMEQKILLQITQDITADKIPLINIDSLTNGADLSVMLAIMSDLDPQIAMARIIKNISVSLTTKRSIVLSLHCRDIMVSTCPYAGATDEIHAKLDLLLKAEEKRNQNIISQMNAEDVLASQTRDVQNLITGTEKALVDTLKKDRIPIVFLDTDITHVHKCTPYIASSNAYSTPPMLMQIFKHYMKLKHSVNASLHLDENAKFAIIEISK
jgi:hypothetical protein